MPIGTRDPGALELIIDGAGYAIDPEPGRFARRSFRVRVRGDGVDVLFTPASGDAHRLVRGRKYRGDNEIGMFTRSDDGIVEVEWSREITVLGVSARAAEPTPMDAALGFALAAAFGTGARLMLMAIVGGIFEAFLPP